MITEDSPLLFNAPPLVVLPDLAVAIGLNEAIILQQLHYLVRLSKGRRGHLKDGRWWTWQTYEHWQRQFPWWSIGTIRRTLASLSKKLHVVLIGHFSKAPDTTLWYTIDYQAYNALINKADQSKEEARSEGDQVDHPIPGRVISLITQDDQVDQSERSERSDHLYTEITPEITPEITLPPLSPQGEPEQERESGESKPIKLIPEPTCPTFSTSLQSSTNLLTQPATPHVDQDSDASLIDNKAINKANEQIKISRDTDGRSADVAVLGPASGAADSEGQRAVESHNHRHDGSVTGNAGRDISGSVERTVATDWRPGKNTRISNSKSGAQKVEDRFNNVFPRWRNSNAINDYKHEFIDYLMQFYLPQWNPWKESGAKPTKGDAKNWIAARELRGEEALIDNKFEDAITATTPSLGWKEWADEARKRRLLNYSQSHGTDILVHLVGGSSRLWSELRSLAWEQVSEIANVCGVEACGNVYDIERCEKF